MMTFLKQLPDVKVGGSDLEVQRRRDIVPTRSRCFDGRADKMRGLRLNRAKSTTKIVHGTKVGRPMSLAHEFAQKSTMWWCGRAKKKIGCENADSFTMRECSCNGGTTTEGTLTNLSYIGYVIWRSDFENAVIRKRLFHSIRKCYWKM